jgi:hypothetical protein
VSHNSLTRPLSFAHVAKLQSKFGQKGELLLAARQACLQLARNAFTSSLFPRTVLPVQLHSAETASAQWTQEVRDGKAFMPDASTLAALLALAAYPLCRTPFLRQLSHPCSSLSSVLQMLAHPLLLLNMSDDHSNPLSLQPEFHTI